MGTRETIPTSGGVPVLTVSVSGNNDGIQYQSAIETFGVEYSNYLAYTYEAFTYTNIGGVVDVGVQYHRGEIGGYSAGAQLGAAILFGGAGVKAYKSATKLVTHLNYLDEVGATGYRTLESGRIRYYGSLQTARNSGEMKGRRYVQEWDPNNGSSRGWHETLDHSGNVRIVRPEMNNGVKTHYTFDEYGNYEGHR